jgi:hypothetical protein
MIQQMEENVSIHSSENVDRLIWSQCILCLEVPMLLGQLPPLLEICLMIAVIMKKCMR